MENIYSALIPTASASTRDAIARILRDLPPGVLQKLADTGSTIRPLQRGERYDEASPALKRLGIDVDRWPAPPAGLFVVEERTVYLRSRSRMTVVHEVMHALDAACGGGVYLSGTDPEFRRLFCAASSFVTPYAASGIDEAWAEAARAYAGDFNDAASHWPRATRERLLRIDPATYAYFERIFGELAASGAGEQLEMVLR